MFDIRVHFLIVTDLVSSKSRLHKPAEWHVSGPNTFNSSPHKYIS